MKRKNWFVFWFFLAGGIVTFAIALIEWPKSYIHDRVLLIIPGIVFLLSAFLVWRKYIYVK